MLIILLMEEILHHLECLKHCKQWDKLPTSTGAGSLQSTVVPFKKQTFFCVSKRGHGSKLYDAGMGAWAKHWHGPTQVGAMCCVFGRLFLLVFWLFPIGSEEILPRTLLVSNIQFPLNFLNPSLLTGSR